MMFEPYWFKTDIQTPEMHHDGADICLRKLQTYFDAGGAQIPPACAPGGTFDPSGAFRAKPQRRTNILAAAGVPPRRAHATLQPSG